MNCRNGWSIQDILIGSFENFLWPEFHERCFSTSLDKSTDSTYVWRAEDDSKSIAYRQTNREKYDQREGRQTDRPSNIRKLRDIFQRHIFTLTIQWVLEWRRIMFSLQKLQTPCRYLVLISYDIAAWRKNYVVKKDLPVVSRLKKPCRAYLWQINAISLCFCLKSLRTVMKI